MEGSSPSGSGRAERDVEDCEEGAGAWQRAESREQRVERRLDGAEETLAQQKASLIIGVLDI